MKPRSSTCTLSILKGITSWGGVITTLAGVAYGIADGVSILSYSVTLSGVILTSAGHIIGHVQARHQRTATAAAEAKISEALKEASAAKEVSDELIRPTSKRVITDEQKSKLVSALKEGPKGKVVVTFLAVESDAQKYAEQVNSILNESGYTSRISSSNRWLQLALDGLFITTKEGKQIPSHGPFIQKVFKAVGISVDGFQDSSLLRQVGAHDDDVVFAVSNRI